MDRLLDAIRASATALISAGLIFSIILYVLIFGIDDENEYLGGDDDQA